MAGKARCAAVPPSSRLSTPRQQGLARARRPEDECRPLTVLETIAEPPQHRIAARDRDVGRRVHRLAERPAAQAEM